MATVTGTRPVRRGSLCLAACAALVLVLAQTGAAEMLTTPYLQAVTTDSVYVLVECRSEAPVTVEYGPTPAYGWRASAESVEATDASPATYVHNVKLTGLGPDRLYHYRVWHQDEVTDDNTFVTAVEPGTPFRFAWMADCRTGVDVHDQVAGRIRQAGPRFSLYGGDLCENPDYGFWKSQFFTPNESALDATVPFFNAVGNHESWRPNTMAFTQAPRSGSGTQDYYSFDYGDVHFVAVNNEIPYIPGSPQWDFVARDLSTADKPWKVVFAHKPAYAPGHNGEDPDMQAMTTYIFEPCGVDVVIAGHNHFYQHCLVRGIHHVVAGSAGAPLKNPGTADYTIKALKDYSYAIVDVTSTTLHMVVYNNLGQELETIDLAKTGPPKRLTGPLPLPPAPPPPPPKTATLIGRNSTWKYSAAAGSPDPAWRVRSFSDKPWSSGNAVLGFGEPSVKTTLPAGFTTYYFRKVFTLGTDTVKLTRLLLSAKYDDGFIAYLNGEEVARVGLPPPPAAVTYDTPAEAREAGAGGYETIDLSAYIARLVRGPNLLAVEVHQEGSAADDDLAWDAELTYEYR